MTELLKLDEKSALTLDGRILRYGEMVNQLTSHYELKVSQNFHAWQIERIFRRDFNYLAHKIFIRFRTQSKSLALENQISALMQTARTFARACEALDQTFYTIGFEHSHCIPVRIVSENGAFLLRTLSYTDSVMARLNVLAKTEYISQKQANTLTDMFFREYYKCKAFVLERKQI